MANPDNPLEGRYEVRENGCWIWKAAHGGRGYGRVRFMGKTNGAHRVSFYLANGYWPRNTRHTCDTPLCVNPKHLIDGTKKDNSQDMVERGRSTYGERNPMAKLTSKQVTEIRESKEPTRFLMKQYGVSRATVKYIRAGTTWRNI
jgi:hypothetical protein